jgi:DNA modification methylase
MAYKHQLRYNTIYCGDNLKMLKEIPSNSIDLIYIDPPFNSNRNYEVFWGDTQEKRAFEDRFGDADAYISYMRPRIMELHRVLKETGSFYYHCDWHAGHYVKVLLDQVFGFDNFRNEIVWHYRKWATKQAQFCSNHDTIFFYSKTKSKKRVFNHPYMERAPSTLKRFGKSKIISGFDEQGNRLPSKTETFDSEGVPMDDVWDIGRVPPIKQLYPTEKPLKLLERIIEASSSRGDVVLDAFCGCGTTLAASHKLGRKWIGIDISPTACRVMSQRLWDNFKLEEGIDFFIEDLKKSKEELRQLPHFEFQNWACIALGGIPNKVKSGDYGIDGKLYPIEFEKRKKLGQDIFGDLDIYYPIQVKQVDKAGRPDIDSFETAILRDGRRKGYFVAFDFSTDAIREIKRLDKVGEIQIVPITVDQLIKMEVSA